MLEEGKREEKLQHHVESTNLQLTVETGWNTLRNAVCTLQGSLLTTVLLMFLIWLTVLTGKVSGDVSYTYPMLCQTHEGKTVWTLPPRINCSVVAKAPTGKQPELAVIQLYKHNMVQYETNAWVCKMVKQKVETFTYFFNDENLKKQQTVNLQVSGEACHRMKRWLKCDSGDMLEKGGLHQTNNILNWYYPGGGINCCKWKKFTVVNCFMYKAKAFKRHNNAHMESTVGDVSHCSYTSGECQMKDGSFLIWEVQQEERCQYLKWLRTPGRMLQNQWLSDDGNLALTWPLHGTKEVVSCFEPVSMSDQGIAFRILDRASTVTVFVDKPPRIKRHVVQQRTKRTYNR